MLSTRIIPCLDVHKGRTVKGINFINLPSTLLSQVDSCIGGKTGINSKHGKNLIGSFYNPKVVISETELLKSLPLAHLDSKGHNRYA